MKIHDTQTNITILYIASNMGPIDLDLDLDYHSQFEQIELL